MQNVGFTAPPMESAEINVGEGSRPQRWTPPVVLAAFGGSTAVTSGI